MEDPIAFFLTWVTYGTWLPGDARGWVEYRHGWKPPQPALEFESLLRMSEDACRLDPRQRSAVERQIEKTCEHRSWKLWAVNCRSNHVHAVVSAATKPKKIRSDLKAWATRHLRENFNSKREEWWAERGSIRFLYRDEDLEGAIAYVADGQDSPAPRST